MKKSSVYLSIFKRKGIESQNTKIITETNIKDYQHLFPKLGDKENPLLISFSDLSNWFLLTDDRILMSNNNSILFLPLTDIIEVRPALEEEMADKVFDKKNFTRLKIKNKDGRYFICTLEHGEPFEGIYQVLHFIASDNR